MVIPALDACHAVVLDIGLTTKLNEINNWDFPLGIVHYDSIVNSI